MSTTTGLPGGCNAAITNVAVPVDLSALAGCGVLIWCDEQNIKFCFAADGTNTTLVTGAQAASSSALVADEVGAGAKVPRKVSRDYPFLIVATAAGSGTLRVKPISFGADVQGVAEEPSGAAAGSAASVTSAQLPATLGQKTGALSLSVVQASDVGTVTDGVNTAKVTAASTAPAAADKALVVSMSPNRPAWTRKLSTALEASNVVKNTAGRARSLSVRIDSTAPSGDYVVQVIDSATLPADGAVTLLDFQKRSHVVGQHDYVVFDWSSDGPLSFSSGLVVVLSTTEFTKSIAGAYLSIVAEYT